MESSDLPLSAQVIRGSSFGGDFGGMKFLTRESLLRKHLAMVFCALGVAEEQQMDLLKRLPEQINGVDHYRLISEGAHGFDRERVQIFIDKFKGEIGACLGDPFRFIEERIEQTRGAGSYSSGNSARSTGGGWCSR